MMRAGRGLSRAATALFCAGLTLADGALAAGLRPEVLERWAGVWSSDCAAAQAPRLTVSADTLAFQADGVATVGTGAMSGYALFGQMQPPEGFVVGLMSSAIEAIAFESAQGDYLTLTRGPEASGVDGRTRLFDCDPERRAARLRRHAEQAAR